MAHKRKAIRQALVTLLTNATDAQDRVYPNRARNLSLEQLPAIIVHDGPEAVVPRDTTTRQYIRDWTASLEVIIASNDRPDESLDDLLTQIEDLLSANRTIDGNAMSALYAGTDEPTFDSQSQTTIVTATVRYTIRYIA